MQVGPCIPVGIQLYKKSEVDLIYGPTLCLSHFGRQRRGRAREKGGDRAAGRAGAPDCDGVLQHGAVAERFGEREQNIVLRRPVEAKAAPCARLFVPQGAGLAEESVAVDDSVIPGPASAAAGVGADCAAGLFRWGRRRSGWVRAIHSGASDVSPPLTCL